MMAVILSFFETWDARDHVTNDQRDRDYTRSFKAIVSSPTIDPAEIRLYPSCPRVWQIYASAGGKVDTGSWCREVKVTQDATDPYLFLVQCRYSSRIERPDINLVENPLLRPADISWGSEARTRVAWADSGGLPIYNSAKERFDPPLEIEERIVTLTIAKNQLRYDSFGYVDFINCLNLKAWFGQPPGKVKCADIKGERIFENGLLFWRATFVFHFRKPIDADPDLTEEQQALQAWDFKVLDQGYMKLDGTGRPVPVIRFGQPVQSPVLLDGAGGELAVGGDPVFLNFAVLQSKDFNDLNLV